MVEMLAVMVVDAVDVYEATSGPARPYELSDILLRGLLPAASTQSGLCLPVRPEVHAQSESTAPALLSEMSRTSTDRRRPIGMRDRRRS